MEVQSVEDRAAQPQAANNLPEEKGNLVSVVQKFVSGRPDDRGRKEVEARWTMYQEQLRKSRSERSTTRTPRLSSICLGENHGPHWKLATRSWCGG